MHFKLLDDDAEEKFNMKMFFYCVHVGENFMRAINCSKIDLRERERQK